MITLYTWTTPNGRKISILQEELGVPYEMKPINIGANEQFAGGDVRRADRHPALDGGRRGPPGGAARHGDPETLDRMTQSNP